MKITHHFRGTYGKYLKLIKKKTEKPTTLGSDRLLPKISPDTDRRWSLKQGMHMHMHTSKQYISSWFASIEWKHCRMDNAAIGRTIDKHLDRKIEMLMKAASKPSVHICGCWESAFIINESHYHGHNYSNKLLIFGIQPCMSWTKNNDHHSSPRPMWHCSSIDNLMHMHECQVVEHPHLLEPWHCHVGIYWHRIEAWRWPDFVGKDSLARIVIQLCEYTYSKWLHHIIIEGPTFQPLAYSFYGIGTSMLHIGNTSSQAHKP
jgi:hypothetical protein